MSSNKKVALVTGASQGLGLALSEGLAARGWTVVGVARDGARLRAAFDGVPGGVAVQGDLGEPEDAARIALAAAGVGPVELLIHNASTLGPTPLRPLLDLEPDALQEVLEVNLLGPFRLTRVVAGAMSLRGRGTVVFVSSDAAVNAYPGWGPYGLSKAAADHLAGTWGEELPELRFLAVDPGEMDTAMHAAAMPDADRSTLARPKEAAARILGILDGAGSGRVAS